MTQQIKPLYLWIDQQGNQFRARTLKELREQIPGHVSIMYSDRKNGETALPTFAAFRVGYVIGSHWLRQYAPVETPV